MAAVAFLYDRYHPQIGGIERMMAEVGVRLTSTHQVTIFAEAAGQLPRTSEDQGCLVLRCTRWSPPPESLLKKIDLALGFGYTPFSPRCLFPLKLANTVLRLRIPLAWCPTYYPVHLPNTTQRHRPFWKRLIPGPLRNLARSSFDRSYHRVFSQSSTLFALTEREQRHWKELFPSQRVLLVPHGIGAGHLTCIDKAAAREWMKARFGPGPHITSVGRFVNHKNQRVVIHAFPEVRRQFPSAQLVLVGPHQEGTGPALQEMAGSSPFAGMVSFTGKVSEQDLCRLYAGSTFVVHPSRHEASGLTPLEALAHGTPVLHSGSGALDRYDCLPGCYRVSEPEIPASWARAMAELLEDSESIRERAAQGQRAVRDEYTWEIMAEVISREVEFLGSRT
jgi:glycosyltransferase involved in cell wall biosynthesis